MRVDSRGRVVIGYPAHEEAELATRGNPKLLFHILRFTPAGKLDFSISVPTDNIPHNAVYLDSQDHIFAVANGMLQMLTGDDDQTRAEQRSWKSVTSCSWFSQGCRIEQSPTRQRLFITRCLGGNPFCEKPDFTVYDTASPEPKIDEKCIRLGGRITDKFRYLSGWDKGYYTRRYPLCSSAPEARLPVLDDVCDVLDDNLLVICGSKDKKEEIGVITAQGETKFRLRLPKSDAPPANIDYVKGDSSGGRFAIVIDTQHGGSSALDISGHLTARKVAVYNSQSGAELATVSVYPPVPHYGVALAIVPGFTFDISPDGRTLAVLSEGVLTIRKLE